MVCGFFGFFKIKSLAKIAFFFALEVSADCLLLLHLGPKLLIVVVMVIFVYLFPWIFSHSFFDACVNVCGSV